VKRETLKQVQGDAKVVVFRVTQRQKRDAEAIGVKRENRFTPFFCLSEDVLTSFLSLSIFLSFFRGFRGFIPQLPECSDEAVTPQNVAVNQINFSRGLLKRYVGKRF